MDRATTPHPMASRGSGVTTRSRRSGLIGAIQRPGNGKRPTTCPPAKDQMALFLCRAPKTSSSEEGKSVEGGDKTKMMEEQKARLRVHANNIHRYRRLLKGVLTDHERQFLEGRLSEEQSAVLRLNDRSDYKL